MWVSGAAAVFIYIHTYILSVTRKVQIPNSTDLSFGRRPESKSVEFGICTLLIIEILAILSVKRLKCEVVDAGSLW